MTTISKTNGDAAISGFTSSHVAQDAKMDKVDSGSFYAASGYSKKVLDVAADLLRVGQNKGKDIWQFVSMQNLFDKLRKTVAVEPDRKDVADVSIGDSTTYSDRVAQRLSASDQIEIVGKPMAEAALSLSVEGMISGYLNPTRDKGE